MFLDDTYSYNAIQQFAAEANKLEVKERKFLDEFFHDNQSDEFYQGLLSGYANAYALFQKNIRPSEFEKVIAFIADKLAKRGF